MFNDEIGLVSVLGAELKHMYEDAPYSEKVTMIHLFGIMNGQMILDNDIKATDIVRAANIHASYDREVYKGIKLSKYVELRPDVQERIKKWQNA